MITTTSYIKRKTSVIYRVENKVNNKVVEIKYADF